jgi:hypothetical protein
VWGGTSQLAQRDNGAGPLAGLAQAQAGGAAAAARVAGPGRRPVALLLRAGAPAGVRCFLASLNPGNCWNSMDSIASLVPSGTFSANSSLLGPDVPRAAAAALGAAAAPPRLAAMERGADGEAFGVRAARAGALQRRRRVKASSLPLPAHGRVPPAYALPPRPRAPFTALAHHGRQSCALSAAPRPRPGRCPRPLPPRQTWSVRASTSVAGGGQWGGPRRGEAPGGGGGGGGGAPRPTQPASGAASSPR